MLNNNYTKIENDLLKLGLSKDQVNVYLCVLEKPRTHLEIARKTGVNRTKVYRIADELEAMSLITHQQSDTGKSLVANDPANLEMKLSSQEEQLKLKRQALEQTLPSLKQIFSGSSSDNFNFSINTYEGTSGIKQMLWNELRTKGEICIYVFENLEKVAGKRWAEMYRQKITEASIPHRVLENTDADHALDITEFDNYKTVYEARYIDRAILDIQQELTIHDDVVSIYNWNSDNNGSKVGLEIHSPQFANFQRSIFETYWSLANNPNPRR